MIYQNMDADDHTHRERELERLPVTPLWRGASLEQTWIGLTAGGLWVLLIQKMSAMESRQLETRRPQDHS